MDTQYRLTLTVNVDDEVALRAAALGLATGLIGYNESGVELAYRRTEHVPGALVTLFNAILMRSLLASELPGIAGAGVSAELGPEWGSHSDIEG